TGTLTLEGTTTGPATNVTVSGATSVSLYGDNTFAATNLTLVDGINTFTATAKDAKGRTSSTNISVTLTASATMAYDLNGNLRTTPNSGQPLCPYDYDDENQLIRIPAPSTWKTEFAYDGKMRRRIRREYAWQNSQFIQTNEVHYVYD